MKPSLLVTGDLVLDCHLYGGVRTQAGSNREPGTRYVKQLGGAVLTQRVALAAAQALETMEQGRTGPRYSPMLGLKTDNLEEGLPPRLHSHGLWAGMPVRKDAKENVWRLAQHVGYGPSVEDRKKSDPEVPRIAEPIFQPCAVEEPALTLIDDAGILFRYTAHEQAWPPITPDGKGYYLLKMNGPLCRGDLWAALDAVRDRLIVVVSAEDLRKEDAQINARLSWEQCVEDTLRTLQNNPVIRPLLRAAHLVVSYRSAGVLWVERGTSGVPPTHRLFFDGKRLEHDPVGGMEGEVYGYQTCLTVAIAHHLMSAHALALESQGTPCPFENREAFVHAMADGIASGSFAKVKLLELGHGAVGNMDPGFPFQEIGKAIASSSGGFNETLVPSVQSNGASSWTILAQSESVEAAAILSDRPFTGLALLTARYGKAALSFLPALDRGGLFSIDRGEIESLRTLECLIKQYETEKVQKKPLSIGVFGPPGAGKSFGVKALAKAVLGPKVPFLEFNLSQFKGPDELIGAFHRVRDEVLQGITPVAFWDEFDSREYMWLQYLLAPMQDGAFQEGQITHPTGKCIFIFAGGTSPSLDEFGVQNPGPEPDPASPESRSQWEKKQDRYLKFRLLKGPDFISRLHGYLNVLGPNERISGVSRDLTWPVRRALMLRGILRLDKEELDMDASLLQALLEVPRYHHGARSFEKILLTLAQGRIDGHYCRSALPPRDLLDRETDAESFYELMTRSDAFKNFPDLEFLARAIHYRFLDEGIKSKVLADTSLAWNLHPDVNQDYEKLSADSKAANVGAALRIPDHLALIGYKVIAQEGDDTSWTKPLEAELEKHLDRLARAEHLGWCAERRSEGWVYDPKRDNAAKHHPLLVDWDQLPHTEKEKDRTNIRYIPTLLEMAKFKAVSVGDPCTGESR